MPVKSLYRDKLEDDELDLSLMQLEEVPVQQLALLPKGTSVDLSNNLLSRLPENFPTLTHILKLDLSKNRLVELPEYFGQLKNLRHLDLYSNSIQRLPVSFCQLKSLKWLDLKNNPLTPAIQHAAGPCITAQDCAQCAKKVVALMKEMHAQMEKERQRIAIEERRQEEAKRLAEEKERERIRAEKKAMKAKKKQDNRSNKGAENSAAGASQNTRRSAANGDRDQTPRFNQGNAIKKNHNEMSSRDGVCWPLFMALLSITMLIIGAAVSTLWIYTGGRLDQASVERAVPIIQRDFDSMTRKVGETFGAFSKTYLYPFGQKLVTGSQWLWEELQRRNKLAAYYINENLGPSFCAAKKQMWEYWGIFKINLQYAWEQSRPYLKELQLQLMKWLQILVENLKVYIPKILDFVYDKLTFIATQIQTAVQGLI